ncbi:unnamed protein product [Prorocentrum cordatum]|uniref:Uncharacterized protein n=1 Tax=Prorocentrum cordatum TaxID=2364126 RepID=A0ABN9TR20_9DINO|nr:unnamed protein product [Polarella glacialis]
MGGGFGRSLLGGHSVHRRRRKHHRTHEEKPGKAWETVGPGPEKTYNSRCCSSSSTASTSQCYMSPGALHFVPEARRRGYVDPYSRLRGASDEPELWGPTLGCTMGGASIFDRGASE